MNRKVHPDFINLKHKINACKTIDKLELLRQVIIRFHKNNIEDGGRLLVEFMLKEQVLNPDYRNDKEYENRGRDWEEDSMDSLFHQKLCGGHSLY